MDEPQLKFYLRKDVYLNITHNILKKRTTYMYFRIMQVHGNQLTYI